MLKLATNRRALCNVGWPRQRQKRLPGHRGRKGPGARRWASGSDREYWGKAAKVKSRADQQEFGRLRWDMKGLRAGANHLRCLWGEVRVQQRPVRRALILSAYAPLPKISQSEAAHQRDKKPAAQSPRLSPLSSLLLSLWAVPRFFLYVRVTGCIEAASRLFSRLCIRDTPIDFRLSFTRKIYRAPPPLSI